MRRLGFSLMELVVVIAVIALLAGLTAPSLFRHMSDARVSAAKADLATLSLSLEAYGMHMADYPSTATGLNALIVAPAGADARWRGPYLKGSVPLDPWGRPYRYESPGRINVRAYDLWTDGRDGKPGGMGEDADLRAWEQARP